MMKKYGVFLFLPLLALSSCGNNSNTFLEAPPVVSGDTYSNPVYASSMPDPSIIREDDGYFYLYATEDKRNLPILRSKNLLDWLSVGTAFTDETRPNFEPNGGLWAPDINKIGDKYVLYYSMSVWGGEQTCGIGVAIADKPEGPFTDKGKLFRSNEIGVTNSIDPFYIEENSRKYLFWGSFRGIYVIELSDDGLTVASNGVKKQIAGTVYEGTYILKRNGFYYLFASTGTCCEGIKSTYQTVVGRSKTLLGGYVDKKGKSMMENSHEILVSKSNRFVGNGHNSEIIDDNEGKTWFLYHGVDLKKPEGRILLLDEVNWDERGWPYVRGNSPSLASEKPNF